MLERQFPDQGSDAAAEGTLAHELAELKLRNFFQAADFGKTKFTRAVNALKRDPLWKDEMQGYTDTYLDYVKSLSLGFENTPSAMVEKHIDLDMYIPSLPEEDPAGGTADCILIGGGVPAHHRLQVRQRGPCIRGREPAALPVCPGGLRGL